MDVAALELALCQTHDAVGAVATNEASFIACLSARSWEISRMPQNMEGFYNLIPLLKNSQ